MKTSMMAALKDSETITEFVRTHPILYDTSLPGYKNQYEKNKLWEELGDICDKKAEEMKSKWKNMRDTYGKYLKAQKCTEGTAMYRYSKWHWGPKMEFLKDHMPIATDDTENESKVKERDGESNVDQSSEGVECSSRFETRSIPSPSPVPKPSLKQMKSNRADKVIWSINERANKLSSTEHIMLGYAKVIDGFSTQRRIETKMKIAQVMMEAELAEEYERNWGQDCEPEGQNTDPLREMQPAELSHTFKIEGE